MHPTPLYFDEEANIFSRASEVKDFDSQLDGFLESKREGPQAGTSTALFMSGEHPGSQLGLPHLVTGWLSDKLALPFVQQDERLHQANKAWAKSGWWWVGRKRKDQGRVPSQENRGMDVGCQKDSKTRDLLTKSSRALK